MIPKEYQNTKYKSIAAALRTEIAVAPDDRLAGERDLAERFGVSRVTVRRALRELEEAGVLHRAARSGTYAGRGRRRILWCQAAEMNGFESTVLHHFAHFCTTRGWMLELVTALAAEPEQNTLVCFGRGSPAEQMMAWRDSALRFGNEPGPETAQLAVRAFDFGYRGMRRLIADGRRRIGVLAEELHPELDAAAFLAGARAALAEERRRIPDSLFTAVRPSGGAAAFLAQVEFEQPDALLLGSDALAMNVLPLAWQVMEQECPAIQVSFEPRTIRWPGVRLLMSDAADAAQKLVRWVERPASFGSKSIRAVFES